MTDQPLVSVLCATYQYGSYVAGAIDSVLAQSYPHIELVVVDDGSTDDTAAVLAGYGERIIAVSTANRGQNAAFNTAFEHSHGDIVCLLDADDRMRADKIATIVDTFTADGEIGWVFHDLRYVDLASGAEVPDPSTAVLPLPPTGRYDMRAVMRAGELPIVAPAASGLVFRRDALAAILPLPELKGFGDHFLKFAAMSATPGFYLDDQLAEQGIHATNAFTNSVDTVTRARRMINVSRELDAWDPTLAPFTDRLFVQGLIISGLGRRLPPAERASVRAWWELASWPRRRRLIRELAKRYRNRARGRRTPVTA